MKFGKFLLALLFIGSLFTYSCKPDRVEPNRDADMGAFALAEAPLGDEHVPPDPKCGPELVGQLYISAYGQVFPLNGSEYLMVNGKEDLYISIKGLPGWVFYETGCHVMPVGGTPPTWTNPTTNAVENDLTQFTFYKDHTADNSLQNKRTWRVDMSSLEQTQTYSIAAVLGRWDFTTGQPIGAPFTVWVNGKPIQGPGGFTLDYSLAICQDQTCQPWLNASNPCLGPCDTTWVQNYTGGGSNTGGSGSGSGSGSNSVSCCKGGIAEITVEASTAGNYTVTDDNGVVASLANASAGDLLVIGNGIDKLDHNLTLTISGVGSWDLHTSCSKNLI